MVKKKSREIQKLLDMSNSGNFRSTYQLAMSYLKGIGVNKSLKDAELLMKLCAEQLDKYQFRIESIKLLNFRGYENLTVNFSPKSNIAVIVGNNGSGKSTILDAIKKSLTHLSSRLTTRSFNGDSIDLLEINNCNEADFATIIPTLTLNNHPFKMELSQSKPLKPNKDSKYEEINVLANIFKQVNSVNNDFNFPLLACYNVERANEVTTKDIENSAEIKDNQIWDKSKAYSKSLNGKADFKLFFRWFKESIEEENADNSDVKALKATIKSKEEELNNPILKELISDSGSSSSAKALIEKYAKDINDLKLKLNSSSNLKNKTLEVVRGAIYTFLPGFSNLNLQLNPLDLTMMKNGVVLSVLQLSQGEKSILALVADIARRLTLLNPKEDFPLNGTGIVLIDEIDLHLHPEWQQLVIPRLQTTFPNIQFIITTHSPQVLTTVDVKNIIKLKKELDLETNDFLSSVEYPQFQTFGFDSSTVMNEIMDTAQRPENKFSKKLSKYISLIEQSVDLEKPDVVALKDSLQTHFGENHPAIIECNRLIRMQKRKKLLGNKLAKARHDA